MSAREKPWWRQRRQPRWSSAPQLSVQEVVSTAPLLGGADLRLREQLRLTGAGAVLGEHSDVLQLHQRDPNAVEPRGLVHQVHMPDDVVAVHQQQAVAGVVPRPVEPAEEVFRGRAASHLFQEFDQQPVIAEIAGHNLHFRGGSS